MKKLLVSVLAIVMVLSMAACGTKTPATTTGADTTTAGAVVDDGTFGSFVLNIFHNLVKDSKKDVLEIANDIITNETMPVNGLAEEVVPGLLAGFDNHEINGFTKGARFAPMIGSIPFIGYVFELDENADVNAFVAELKDNANPRWNICVEADQVVAEAVGNIVFFTMCPASME